MKKTARAHTNIALIKYWGKADNSLRLPLMSSLSLTLDAFYSDTSVEKTDGPN
ncbi:MAG TPA: diphosphomevalonate decarboxylase, partial [Lactobacillus acetotolerans]|nr:diphosphomevalonate decarboxylase [Lactobacillus acetotolerans]